MVSAYQQGGKAGKCPPLHFGEGKTNQELLEEALSLQKDLKPHLV